MRAHQPCNVMSRLAVTIITLFVTAFTPAQAQQMQVQQTKVTTAGPVGAACSLMVQTHGPHTLWRGRFVGARDDHYAQWSSEKRRKAETPDQQRSQGSAFTHRQVHKEDRCFLNQRACENWLDEKAISYPEVGASSGCRPYTASARPSQKQKPIKELGKEADSKH